jgi:hypothetical protein
MGSRAMPASGFDRRVGPSAEASGQGLRWAIQWTLFHLLGRETRGDEEWSVLDEGRLRERAQQDLAGFLDWDTALLRVVVEGEEG